MKAKDYNTRCEKSLQYMVPLATEYHRCDDHFGDDNTYWQIGESGSKIFRGIFELSDVVFDQI